MARDHEISFTKMDPFEGSTFKLRDTEHESVASQHTRAQQWHMKIAQSHTTLERVYFAENGLRRS